MFVSTRASAKPSRPVDKDHPKREPLRVAARRSRGSAPHCRVIASGCCHRSMPDAPPRHANHRRAPGEAALALRSRPPRPRRAAQRCVILDGRPRGDPRPGRGCSSRRPMRFATCTAASFGRGLRRDHDRHVAGPRRDCGTRRAARALDGDRAPRPAAGARRPPRRRRKGDSAVAFSLNADVDRPAAARRSGCSRARSPTSRPTSSSSRPCRSFGRRSSRPSRRSWRSGCRCGCPSAAAAAACAASTASTGAARRATSSGAPRGASSRWRRGAARQLHPARPRRGDGRLPARLRRPAARRLPEPRLLHRRGLALRPRRRRRRVRRAWRSPGARRARRSSAAAAARARAHRAPRASAAGTKPGHAPPRGPDDLDPGNRRGAARAVGRRTRPPAVPARRSRTSPATPGSAADPRGAS